MRQRNTFPVLVCIFALIFFLSGCGPSQTPGSDSAKPTPSTAVPSTSTPTVASTPMPTATPTAKATTAANASPSSKPTPTSVPTSPPAGAVTLLLNKTHYAPYETIVVTIHNGLAASITTTDHQSGCTLVTLQMQDANGSWQNQASCRQGIATRMITLPAGASMVQSLSPQSGTFARGATWAKGQYRFVFTFSTAAVDTTHEIGTGNAAAGRVYSAVFVIA